MSASSNYLDHLRKLHPLLEMNFSVISRSIHTMTAFMLISKKDRVFLIFAGIFVTNAIVAELIGGKLFSFGPFTLSMGILPWPIVFIATDLINEYFGRQGVRFLTYITVALISITFILLYASMNIPAADISPVGDAAFKEVFAQSAWIIVGSIIAFLVAQLIDISVFWFFKDRTGNRKLWLRATGSTAVSQLIDSFVVIGIAFYLPGKVNFADFIKIASSNYSFKFLVAVGATPLVYLGHYLVASYLKKD